MVSAPAAASPKGVCAAMSGSGWARLSGLIRVSQLAECFKGTFGAGYPMCPDHEPAIGPHVSQSCFPSRPAGDVARFPALGKHLFHASGTHLGFLRRWGPLVPAYSRVSDNCRSNNGTLSPSTYFGFRRVMSRHIGNTRWIETSVTITPSRPCSGTSPSLAASSLRILPFREDWQSRDAPILSQHHTPEAVHIPRSNHMRELRYRNFWLVCGQSKGSYCPRVCRQTAKPESFCCAQVDRKVNFIPRFRRG